MKPLFLPLKSEYFEAFKSGDKTEEYRVNGPRWNERTCTIGRPVILSRGYGKRDRLEGVVSSFMVQHGSQFQGLMRVAIRHCYGTTDLDFACIGITIRGAR